LAVQTRGFERMVASVADSLDDATLADLSIFASDLAEFVRQFPDFRQFLAESAVVEPLAPEQRNAALEVVRTLASQGSDIVEPALKTALLDFEDASSDNPEPFGDLAIVRTAGNLLRAIGRWVKAHAAAVSKQAGSTFDNVGGKFVGTALVGALLGAPALAAMMLLQTAIPQEFAFLGPLVRLIKLLLGA